MHFRNSYKHKIWQKFWWCSLVLVLLGSCATAGSTANVQISSAYIGTVRNTTNGIQATISLSIIQQGTQISGEILFSYPFDGSGPFQGTIMPDGHITFVVSSDDGLGVKLYFTGDAGANGAHISGTYVIDNGQAGRWDVSRNEMP